MCEERGRGRIKERERERKCHAQYRTVLFVLRGKTYSIVGLFNIGGAEYHRTDCKESERETGRERKMDR